MTSSILQNVHLAHLFGEIAQVNTQIRHATEGLNDEQLRWQPPEGGWGIGMVVEHLIIAAEKYFQVMRPALTRAVAQASHSGQPVWKPSIMGKLLVKAIQPSSIRNLKAPKSFSPSPFPREHAVEDFLKQQEDLTGMLRQANGLDLRRIRLGSPVTRLIRLNLGDCFTILVTHARRHLLQIWRIREHESFPPFPAA